jgi:transcriptional regulator with XRE-family HTH domain
MSIVITSEQLRAARQLIRLTADDLANTSGVGITPIRRFEFMTVVPSGNARTLEALQKVIEKAGIEFI